MANDDATSQILAALRQVQDGVTKLEAGQAKLEAGQASLEAGQAKLENAQARLEESQTQLRVELMSRMDRLQNTLTGIRDDIGVNMGRADRAHEAADNTRAELRTLGEVVTGMGRQIQRLQTAVRELRGDP